MSFIEPNFGQVQQNKKILQELEEKKRRMRTNTVPIQLVSETPTNLPQSTSFSVIQPQPTSLQTEPPSLPVKPQQTFTLYNCSNSFGYFLNTDSTLGNQILPVLPRF